MERFSYYRLDLLSIGLTIAFVVGEAASGIYTHSLALLSDAGHNFADAFAMIISGYALWIGRKPSDQKRTYGYHRAGILAALLNAVSLVIISFFIFWEAFSRLRNPEPVQGGPMIWIALIAIVLNGTISLWLSAGAKHDLNMRSTYIHMLGDAISAAGVVVAGIVVKLTGSSLADPIASLLIAIFILKSSWGILNEAIQILMEGVPSAIELGKIESAIQKTPSVLAVHDLHVWTVSSGRVACSCHIVVAEQTLREGQQILAIVVQRLKEQFGITHTTVQVEVDGCDPNDLPCILKIAHPEHEHNHE